jgi:glutathione S-transferase
MKLEVVSWVFCPYVHRVTTLLREKQAAFELKYVDLANKPDWFVRLSPTGMVPVLVADGTPLFESLAINEFVDEACAPRMLPESAIHRARHRAMVRRADDLYDAMNNMLIGPTEEAYEKGRKALNDVLVSYERAIEGPLFAGSTFSLVDAAAAPVLYRAVLLQRNSEARLFLDFPKVSRWAESLADRPSVVGGVVDDYVPSYLKRVRGFRAMSFFANKHFPA